MCSPCDEKEYPPYLLSVDTERIKSVNKIIILGKNKICGNTKIGHIKNRR